MYLRYTGTLLSSDKGNKILAYNPAQALGKRARYKKKPNGQLIPHSINVNGAPSMWHPLVLGSGDTAQSKVEQISVLAEIFNREGRE